MELYFVLPEYTDGHKSSDYTKYVYLVFIWILPDLFV